MMDLNQLQNAWGVVCDEITSLSPSSAVILGSGWSDAVNRLDIQLERSYETIPGLGKTGVVGHAGRMIVAKVGGIHVLIFQGRRHFYEGEGWTPVALPVFLAKQAGVSSLLLTNAAGGIREDLSPGSLMVLRDHINQFSDHPLIGPHLDVWGPRFPDQTAVYDPDLRGLMLKAAQKINAELKEGIYLASTGPTYETPAEIECYRRWGADAVGMSTVPEAMLAHAAGLRVAGLSCISNWAAGITRSPLSHEEVTETTQRVMPIMESLLLEYLTLLTEESNE